MNSPRSAVALAVTVFSFATLASEVQAAVLLQIGTSAGVNTTIQFTPVVGNASSNPGPLTVNPDSDPFFANALGQVALAGFFSSPVALDWQVGFGNPMVLGTSSAPYTHAFSNGLSSGSGTFLLLGSFGATTSGTLAPSTLNPFGTTPWQSSQIANLSLGNFNLINSSGDIVVVTDSGSDSFEVIGQWSFGDTSVIPEPSSITLLVLGALGLLGHRRRNH